MPEKRVIDYYALSERNKKIVRELREKVAAGELTLEQAWAAFAFAQEDPREEYLHQLIGSSLPTKRNRVARLVDSLLE